MSDLLSLPLCKLDRPLKIRSRLLDADLWLVPEGNTEDFDAPTYSLDECRLLQALHLSPIELQAIYLTKKLLHGNLILANATESLRHIYRRLLNRCREVEGRYEAGETALATQLQQHSRQLGRLLNRIEQQGKLR